MSELERTHPDALARQAFWSPQPRVPSSTRIATTIRVVAPRCTSCSSTQWTTRTMRGHGKEKRRLAEPEPVCLRCGEPWSTWDEVDHVTSGAPGGGITRRGSWTRFVHVNPTRAGPRVSAEERLFGDRDLTRLALLHRQARTMYRSRSHYWASRAYFPYVLHFGAVRGRGGVRALVSWAREGYPRAPFAWRNERAVGLIRSGRDEWARRLVRCRLIDGGDWWREDDADSHACGRSR